MSQKILIRNVRIVNENRIFEGSVEVDEGRIAKIREELSPFGDGFDQVIEGHGGFLLPGAIDDQVHFREPGLTHKANIYTESKAAVAGGITSFMEMPNTKPQAVTHDLLEEKYRIAAEKSLANYSFYMGVTNDNTGEVLNTDPQNVCGIKIFMGSSTGNMLVDNKQTLDTLFRESPVLIATHCEDERTIKHNTDLFRKKYGDTPPFSVHPLIRSEEACYRSSSLAAELADKHKSRLHILHLSTAKELALFRNDIPSREKQITAEACIHHFTFDDSQYDDKQWRIKWNPAVKSAQDRDAIFEAMLNNTIDVIATDHAPHTLEEKQNSYFKAPSGGPMVQHALPIMMEFYRKGKISVEKIVEKMSHTPADIFRMDKRGYIREGFWADLVLVHEKPVTVAPENILYKCGWSPLEGEMLHYQVATTMINGHIAYQDGKFDENQKGKRLKFNR